MPLYWNVTKSRKVPNHAWNLSPVVPVIERTLRWSLVNTVIPKINWHGMYSGYVSIAVWGIKRYWTQRSKLASSEVGEHHFSQHTYTELFCMLDYVVIGYGCIEANNPVHYKWLRSKYFLFYFIYLSIFFIVFFGGFFCFFYGAFARNWLVQHCKCDIRN